MTKFEEWSIISVSSGVFFGGVLIEKDSQVTSPYIFYKSSIAFDTIIDVGVIPNPALDKYFLLNYPL